MTADIGIRLQRSSKWVTVQQGTDHVGTDWLYIEPRRDPLCVERGAEFSECITWDLPSCLLLCSCSSGCSLHPVFYPLSDNVLHAYRRDRSGKRPAKGSPEELSWCVLKGNEADMRIRKRAGAKQRAIKQPIGNEALPMRLSFGHRSGLASGAETTVQLFPCHRSSRINFDSLVNLHCRLPILVHLNISTSFLAGPYVSQYHS